MEKAGLGFFLRVVKPIGEGEMPEGDYWLDACGLEFAGHGSVLADGGLVGDSRLRLHTTPLDAEAVVVHAELLQGGEVFVEPSPGEGCLLTTKWNVALLGEDVPVCLEIERRVR